MQPTSLSKKTVTGAMALVSTLLTSACMTSPLDGQEISSRYSTVAFSGNHLYPNSTVQLWARKPGDSFEGFWTARSSRNSGPTPTLEGSPTYPWSTKRRIPSRYWERGLVGYRTEVKASAGAANFLSFEEHWEHCYIRQSTSEEVVEHCAAERTPVARLSTPGFVSAKGDTSCGYGAADCNRCVEGVEDELRALDTDRRDSHEFEVRMPNRLFLKAHLQGAARLPGVGDENWLVMTQHDDKDDNWGRASIMFARFDHQSNGGPWKWASSRDELGSVANRIKSYDTYHPGGLQVSGHILAVANACDRKCLRTKPWIDFYDVSRPEHVREPISELTLGVQDEPGMSKNATATAFTRLDDGRHLVLVTSESSSHDGRAWLYVSDTKTIHARTKWTYVAYMEGRDEMEGWAGSYENVGMLTDCKTGDVYVTAMKPDGGILGGRPGNDHIVDLFKLVPGPRLIKVDRKMVHARLDGCSLKDAGSFHVSPKGKLVLYCMEGVEGREPRHTEPELEEFRDLSAQAADY